MNHFPRRLLKQFLNFFEALPFSLWHQEQADDRSEQCR